MTSGSSLDLMKPSSIVTIKWLASDRIVCVAGRDYRLHQTDALTSTPCPPPQCRSNESRLPTLVLAKI